MRRPGSRSATLLCALALLTAGAAPAAPLVGGADLAWAWPAPPNALGGTFSTERTERLPGSTATYSQAQLHDLFSAVDWRPATHPAMPASVRSGRKPDVMACAFCHMPGGRGRPENAALAGLPASYLRQQVVEMRSGLRQGAVADYRPTLLMHRIASAATSQDIAAAADYFSRLRFRSAVRVVEADTAPRATGVAGIYRFAASGPREPLGHRILEGPDDFERFELRDETVTYTAWVPKGSLARGAVLARKGAPGSLQACSSCHGAGLRGGTLGPPLAGRSPTGMVRQLAAFAIGARNGKAAGEMRKVAQRLTADQMIDAAAYAGSLAP